MADYIARTKTNQFKVKNEERMHELLDGLLADGLNIDYVNGLYQITAYSVLDYSKEPDNEDVEHDIDEFFDELSKIIDPETPAIFQEVGYEKFRHFGGYGIVVGPERVEVFNIDYETNMMAKKIKIDYFNERKSKLIDEYGWCFHYIPDAFEELGLIDTHTHGFESSVNHMNFQIVVPLGYDITKQIFDNLYNQILDGISFEDSEVICGVANTPIRVMKAKDSSNMDVLRLIFPDKNGLFPDDENCVALFKKQVEV